jgi:pyruvate dehydrogenase E1 component alpha subunit
MALSPDDVVVDSLRVEETRELYELMLLVREFNEKATLMQRQGRIHSFLNCIGQEAAIIGSARALKPEDWVFPSYREHPIPLMRGVPLEQLFNHLIGNSADTAKGRNLPPEYSFREVNFVSISAPVGTQLPQATGVARAMQIRGDKKVVLVYCGEGATSQGDFHTALNFAGVWKAPVVFFVQNNGWAISVPSSRQTASVNFSVKARAYGFAGETIDGNDLLAVHRAVSRAVTKARGGDGPTLIEAETYRLGPHSTSDDPKQYRSEEEVREWQQRDPILRTEHHLAEKGAWSEEYGREMRRKAAREVRQAADRALREPLPAVESLFEDVYLAAPWHLQEQKQQYLALRKKLRSSS